jgi:3-hydroxyisobutyrate dehydrogenase-like beta-hydroxyacid dehydrogenase
MSPVVAVISPGAMGSAVGRRLTENGIEVRTSLTGRSAATATRAHDSAMMAVADEQIVAADIVLSIVPPGEALALAERLAPALARAPRKPVYVDCNAVNPETVGHIARVLQRVDCPFVDGGIIGGPPRQGSRTKLYVSGPDAERVTVLEQYGLDMPVLPGPVGVASAMKMSYAGITKGFTALGAMMMLAATRGGTAEFLKRELTESQPPLLDWLTRQTPNMYSKAYRWVAEMEEIAGFTGNDASRSLFEAAARFYVTIAEDYAGNRRLTEALDEFCH